MPAASPLDPSPTIQKRRESLQALCFFWLHGQSNNKVETPKIDHLRILAYVFEVYNLKMTFHVCKHHVPILEEYWRYRLM